MHRARPSGRTRGLVHGRADRGAGSCFNGVIEELMIALAERSTIVAVTHNMQQAAGVPT